MKDKCILSKPEVMKPWVAGTLFIVLFISSFNCKSQYKSVTITSERNSDQSVDFFYTKTDYGSFFLNLIFNDGRNTPYRGVLDGMQGKFHTIRPLNQNNSIGLSYKITWIRGIPNPKIDTSFVYLLPVSKDKTLKAFYLTNINKNYFGGLEPKDWKSFQFNVKQGDTVFSARKGLVVEVIDGNEPDSTLSVSFSSKANSVLVEHEDGTLANYGVLKNGSIMVKPGQRIFPHTPLALAGTFDVEKNTQIRFHVYYLCEKNLDHPDKVTLATRKNYYAFIDPLFHTSEGDVHLKSLKDYTADFSDEYLLKELNKREKKKLGK